MKKRVRSYTSRLSDTSPDFDDLYYEISRDWQHKAEALQTRRWRALKHEIKGNAY
jgi:hypothetical protein